MLSWRHSVILQNALWEYTQLVDTGFFFSPIVYTSRQYEPVIREENFKCSKASKWCLFELVCFEVVLFIFFLFYLLFFCLFGGVGCVVQIAKILKIAGCVHPYIYMHLHTTGCKWSKCRYLCFNKDANQHVKAMKNVTRLNCHPLHSLLYGSPPSRLGVQAQGIIMPLKDWCDSGYYY